MGVPLKAWDDLAPSTQRFYTQFRYRKPTPRLRLAERLYQSGAVPTKKAAARAAGLNPVTYYAMTMPRVGNEQIHQIGDDIDAAIHDRTINMSKVLALLGRKAVGKLNGLMDSNSEMIQLKAAQDLADRSPETSKTIKHEVASISLSGQDAKEMAQALVESARSRDKFSHLVDGDFVKVESEQVKDLPDHAKRLEKHGGDI